MLSSNFIIEAIITKYSTKEMMGSAGDAPIYAVNSRAELNKLITEQKFTSRLAVLIDFGIIVSQTVIDSFKLGIINSHFSLLPEWRGADPITFAILSGQNRTGVSLMLLVEKMDEGPLLAQESLTIKPDETSTSLTDKLIQLSDRLLNCYLPKYVSGELVPHPQSQNNLSYSRKLTKKDGLIDWHKPAEQIEREVRAFATWPKSYTRLGEIEVIVVSSRVVDITTSDLHEGQFLTTEKTLVVQTGERALSVERLKPVGRHEMTTAEFLRGYTSKLKNSKTEDQSCS